MLGMFRRRRLPHWDVPDATYFVTACLAGSIPALGLRELQEYQRDLDARPRPAAMTEADWELHKHKLMFARWDEWLDDRPVVRHLEQPDLARSVQRSLYHFAGTRYHVVAYAIMPSHLHWVFHPTPQWCEEVMRRVGLRPAREEEEQDVTRRRAGQRPTLRTPREIILHSFKSFTAHECNSLLGQEGSFWEAESFDHWVRDDDELRRIIDYVEQNPVKGRLANTAEAFVFSSAHDRRAWRVPAGEPLVPPP